MGGSAAEQNVLVEVGLQIARSIGAVALIGLIVGIAVSLRDELIELLGVSVMGSAEVAAPSAVYGVLTYVSGALLVVVGRRCGEATGVVVDPAA